MNANSIITDEMSLEDKLAAIDAAMKTEAVELNKKSGRPVDAPIDPADVLICEGCE